MSVQLRLLGTSPVEQIRPDHHARPEPGFWIRRFRVLRELAPGNEAIVREIELRRGFNIIWAPSQEPPNEPALFAGSVAGHTAGKTMLCRLIRYVLGERTFATEATRRRVRDKLPTAWVLAEVVVDGGPWVVARPLGIGPHSFCIPDGILDQATDGTDRHEYQEFLGALGERLASSLSVNRFPASDEPVRWEHVLPWLSRDQECRYADFLEWRHTSSDSESPSLTLEERQFIARSVLGLILEPERAEQQRNALLVAEKKEAVARAPLLQHQSQVDHGRVKVGLGVELDQPSTPLFGAQAREELGRQRIALHEREQTLASADRRSEARAALERCVGVEAIARQDLGRSEEALAFEQSTLHQLMGDSQTALIAALPLSREYCGVRMSVAREQGCPLATSAPFSIAERRSEVAAGEELQNQRARVQRLQASVDAEHRALNAAAQATREARAYFLSASTAFDEERGKILTEKARLNQIEQLVRNAERATSDASALAEAIVRIDAEVIESYSRQEQLRREGRTTMERFSATFDYVARAILGDGVTGRVDASGRSLSLVIEEHGERESAALATVRLLAFDLAGVMSSIEGRGGHPRFLMHDGPREADLANDIYGRLFVLVHELERCFKEEPSFQYILTTTSAPPEAFRAEPWLRVTLAGTPAEHRFLRCDL